MCSAFSTFGGGILMVSLSVLYRSPQQIFSTSMAPSSRSFSAFTAAGPSSFVMAPVAAAPLCSGLVPRSGSTRTMSSIRKWEWKPTLSSHLSSAGLRLACSDLHIQAHIIHSPGEPVQPKVKTR